MRLSFGLCAALLLPALAAPQAEHLGESLEARSVKVHANSVLSSLGLTVATTAPKHGKTANYQKQCPFSVPHVKPHNTRHDHDISFPKGCEDGKFIDWRTFKSNGVNLGAWLAKEKTHDPIWWGSFGTQAANTPDEWSFCQALGKRCGPVLEARYASFLNQSTIDNLAKVGINTLRITTTYAAWVKVPGSAFYHGNQQQHLRKITQYAITKYNMHVIIGLHSLPGGTNSLDIGEAFGHDGWFYNATNLAYSLKAVDQVLDFVKSSGHKNAFTIAPLNEVSDNLAGFGSAAGLSDKATNWVITYMNGVFKRVEAVDKRIPVMLQDNFKGASFWSPLFDKKRNLVIDSHVYYFAASGTYSQFVAPAVCGQAKYLAQETKFPVFVGEWSLQTMYNNSLSVSSRKTIFDTQRYAWQKYVAGGAFWTAVSYSNTPVDGQGTQRDYWSYIDLIRAGVITKATTKSYC
ncbi:glucan 1,3-beta-glucosidase A [Fusarium heterosporum]|uniref:glucan 1,3-beta-glucosidase n=1 Tax=Fusarium heterosporum TaxID=42747 RepID=A0A8H5WEB8_FUSHE|nr:glucan 1,3-beta-glucosidase A [Fusarium heterosporum]